MSSFDMLRKIRIKNLLSFRDLSLELGSLNVLIGANASGKSNFIEVLRFLQHTPRNLSSFLIESGGAAEWFWKGDKKDDDEPSLEAEPRWGGRVATYRIELEQASEAYFVYEETLETKAKGKSSKTGASTRWLKRNYDSAELVAGGPRVRPTDRTTVTQEGLDDQQSILSQIKDPVQYRYVTLLAKEFDSIRVYKDWTVGSSSVLRSPQSTDKERHFVAEDASNLAHVLNAMDQDDSLAKVESYLHRLLPTYKRISTQVEGRRIQLALRERSFKTLIPATRMSDGTLRFLGLMAILCHPEPPPLVCIEEPEIGLHPDALGLVAEALKDASSRTQLIVTTHSDALVDALSDQPESVIVCERESDGSSKLQRLKSKDLTTWLEEYGLGEVWRRGELGGNLF